jgi:uncharacterized protein (TIGR00255 family)
MLCSMTGFGTASHDAGALSFRVEIRSVNHRHLLVKSRLTSDFVHLEGDVERIVRKRLDRGAVSVHLNVTTAPEVDTVRFDSDSAARYRKQWSGFSSRLGITDELPLSTLLSLPGVVTAHESPDEEPESQKRRILKLVSEALTRLVEMRGTEGAALVQDLRKNAVACGRIVARIEKRMPRVVREHHRNLTRRVKDLIEGHAGLSPADLAREVALLADRLDVSEEISRLKSHLVQFDAILDKGGATGRKLDFLMQEIFRETNTIGSKCSDAKVSHWVVDAKTHVERLREQVQNLE